jgi:hypothetical protein
LVGETILNKKPLRVAFPVGIGDCHWVLIKMKALSKFFDNRPIHAYINEGPNHATIGFLEMCPQVEQAFVDKNAPYGYDFKPALDFNGQTNPVESGSRNHRHWALLENCINYGGYDVWAVFNPCIDAGIPTEQIWPELEAYGGTEYEYDLNIPDEAYKSVAVFGENPILFYPSGTSANQLFHNNMWTKADWAKTAKLLNNATGKPMVVIGAGSKVDLDYWAELKVYFDELNVSYIDTVGKTNIPQYCALIKRSSVWVGLNSGGGIMAAALKVPTVMLWSDSAYPIAGCNAAKMHTNMQRSWLNKEQQLNYRTISFGSRHCTPENIVKKTLEVAR